MSFNPLVSEDKKILTQDPKAGVKQLLREYKNGPEKHEYKKLGEQKMPDIMIKSPVRYERRGTYIFDADGNMVANVRGWGRISYMEDPEEKQDKMGEFIAQAINEKLAGGDYEL